METSASLELTINANDQASSVLNNVRSAIGGIQTAVGALGLAVAGGMMKAVEATLHYDQLIGRLAKTTGMTAEQTSGLVAAFRSAGMSAELAGSTVQRLEMRLGAIAAQQAAAARSGKASNDVLTQLGISATDASGHVRNMNELMPILIDQLNKVADPAVRARLEMQLFGRNYAQLAPLLEAGGAAFAKNTALAAKFGLVLSQDNIDAMHKFEAAKSSLEMAFQGITVQIGNALIPTLTKLIEAFTSVVAVFDSIPAPTRNLIIQILEGVAVFGTLLGGVAALRAGLMLLAPILGPAMTSALGGFLGGLGMILGPIGVIVAAVMAAKFAYDHFGAAHRELQPLVNALTPLLNGLAAAWATFQAAMAAGVNPLRAAVNGIQAFLDLVFKGQGLGQRFGEAYNAIAKHMQDFFAALKTGGDVVGTLKQVIEDLLRPLDESGRLGQDLADVFGFIYDAGSALVDLVNELFSSFSNQGSLWADLVKIGSEAWGGFITVIDAVWKAVKPLFDDIKQHWPDIKAVIKDIIDNGFNLLKGALEWIRDHHQEIRTAVDVIIAGIAIFLGLQAGQTLVEIAHGWASIAASIRDTAKAAAGLDVVSSMGGVLGLGMGRGKAPVAKEGKVLAGDLSGAERNLAASHLGDIGAKGGVVAKDLEGLAVPIERAASTATRFSGVLKGLLGIGKLFALDFLPATLIFIAIEEGFTRWGQILNLVTNLMDGNLGGAWLLIKQLGQDVLSDQIKMLQDVGTALINLLPPPLRAAFQDFGDILGRVGGQILPPLFAALQAAGRELMNNIGPALATAGKQLAPLGKQLSDLGVVIMPAVVLVLKTLGMALAVLAVVVGALVAGAFKGLVDMLSVVIPAAIMVVTGVILVITGIIQVFAGFIGGVVNVVTDLLQGNWAKAWKDAKAAVKTMADGVVNIVQGLVNIIFGLIVGVFGGILAFFNGFVTGVVGFFKWLFDALVGHSIVVDLVNAVVGYFNWMRDIVVGAVRFLVDTAMRVFNTFKDAFLGVAQIIRDVATGHFGDLKNDIVNLIGRLKDDVLGVFDRLWTAIEGMAGRALDAARSVGSGVVGGIVKGLEDSWWRIASALSWLARDLPQPIKDMFGITSPSSVFAEEVGKPISLGIAKGITDNAVHIARALSGAVDVRPAALAGAMVGGSVGYGSLGGAAGGQVPVNVTTVIQIDRDVLARAINRVMGDKAKLQGMSYGSNA